jgi:ATP-dependent DNA helicase PIF1
VRRAGIGLGKEDASVLVKKVRRNPVAKQRWLKTKCLIIDEVSMVDGDLFDKLSQIGRQIRGNGRPWGGLQLIITGDFFQLPPVPENGREAKFAFDAATWNTSIDHTIGLTQIFRQKDPTFANMLNEMRLGRIDAATIGTFKKLERPLPMDDGIEATELFPTRYEVDSANSKRLAALPGEARPFCSTDSGREDLRDRLLANMMAPKTLALKVGAQVMLIKNLDENMVNGTTGTVLRFVHPDDTVDGGASDDEAATKAKRKLRPFANGDVPKGMQYPLVEFHLANGSKQQILCEPHEWNVELPNGEVQASRKQVPLILAWALSIHKAQGQTLERVRVNLDKVFEKGQAYVALSRATSQEGLQVLGFHPSKVMAHYRVIEFYNRLYSVDQIMAKRGSILTSASTKSSGAPATSSTSNTKAAFPSGTIRKLLQPLPQFRSQAQAKPTPSSASSASGADRKKAMAHAL